MKQQANKISLTDETVVALVNMIRHIIQDEVDKYLKKRNIETFIDLKVQNVSEDGFNTTLKDETTKEIYENIPNHTNIRIKENDFVRMYISNQGTKKYVGQTFGKRNDYLCQTDGEGGDK